MITPPVGPGRHHNANGCAVGRDIAPALDDPNRTWLTAALANPAWAHAAIAKHLTAALGVRVTGNTIARHRAGDCSCQEAGLST